MAFIISTLRKNYTRQMARSLCSIKPPICESSECISNVCGETVVETKCDPFDSFTSKLVQERKEKWKYLNKKMKNVNRTVVCNDASENYYKACDIDLIAVNELIRKAIDSKLHNIIFSLLNICKSKNICPSLALLLEVVGIFSRQGNKSGIEDVQSVCKIHNQEGYVVNAEFKHYLAEATWVNGNVEGSLGMFEDVYKNYPSLRRRVRNMSKYLISECVNNRSEASVVLVTKFSKKCAEDYEDFYFLAHLWECLFLSEWYADQKLASDLIKEYSGIRTIVAVKMYIIASVAIKKNETDTIQRLFEVILHYNMKNQYIYLLRSYFDMKCEYCCIAKHLWFYISIQFVLKKSELSFLGNSS